MLKELRIKDFAIIGELSIAFEKGLTALTGETGAGKSIIVDALGAALGEKTGPEMVRSGYETASVEVFFDVDAIPQAAARLEIDPGDGLMLRRTLSSSAKSRAYINGVMATIQALLETGRELVDIHGQHEHQSLLSAQNQLLMLDGFAGLEKTREDVGELYRETALLKQQIANLELNKAERQRTLEFLLYQVNEIESAALRPGEDEELAARKTVLANLGRLRELAETARCAVYGDENTGIGGPAIDALDRARAALEEAARLDPEAVAEPLGHLNAAIPLVEEAAASLRAVCGRYAPDSDNEQSLDAVEERLEVIDRLKKKYGASIEDIIEFGMKAKAEAEAFSGMGESAEKLKTELADKEGKLQKTAAALTEKRKDAALKAQEGVNAVLPALAMEKAQFHIDITPAQIGSAGADRVEFLFNANPGEALKPLSKTASGGEMSRLMLALKSAIRAKGVPVLVFDEIDAGIGGRTAENVAMKLKELSKSHQVLCITHLAQIASAADKHFLIEKDSKGGRTQVKIKALSGKEREEEIARMLSGSVSETALRHAKELISGSRRK
ncbi:MAG: DNA repair protein RecN [Actinomycetota bacterium]|nr:DNA repair protein RecN [Actinomycetota bacterium]